MNHILYAKNQHSTCLSKGLLSTGEQYRRSNQNGWEKGVLKKRNSDTISIRNMSPMTTAEDPVECRDTAS